MPAVQPRQPRQPGQPKNHLLFDPWNLASSGHQRPDISTDSPAWRHVRTEQLHSQFGGSQDGGKLIPESARAPIGCRDIRSYLGVRKRPSSIPLSKPKLEADKTDKTDDDGADIDDADPTTTKKPCLHPHAPTAPNEKEKKNPIFAGTTIYINQPPSSSISAISDHSLKHLLVTHGANLSLSLARRSVTHVIVGNPYSTPAPGSASTSTSVSGPVSRSGSGPGGGLAARHLQSEINRAGRGGVRVVGVDWVTESLKAGKRQPEARFALDLAPPGQRSVLGMFGR